MQNLHKTASVSYSQYACDHDKQWVQNHSINALMPEQNSYYCAAIPLIKIVKFK